MKFKNRVNGDSFIGLIACPELYGKGFFSRNRQYLIEVDPETNAYKDYHIINPYKKSSLKMVYVKNIKEVK